MTFVTILVLGTVAALVFRLAVLGLYRPVLRQGLNSDSAVHFAIIRELKKDPRSRYIRQYVIGDAPMSYPRAFHRFAALFPLEAIFKRPYLPNLVVFAAFVAVFLGYLHYVEVRHLARGDHFVVVVGAVFCLLVPSNLVFMGSAINYLTLSERLLGRLSCALFHAFVLGAMLWHDTALLVAAVAAGTLAVLASRFARQALIFPAPVVALVAWDPAPLVAALGAVLVALALSRGYLVASLRDTARYLSQYLSVIKDSPHLPNHASRFVDPGVLLNQRFDWKVLRNHLLNREPTRALILYPELLVFAALALGAGQAATEWCVLLAPVAGPLVIYLATSSTLLNVFGQSYRYIEFALYFVLPLGIAVLSLQVSQGFLLTVSALYALYLVIVSAVLTRHTLRLGWPERDVLLEFLDRIPFDDNAVVYPITFHLAADICARREELRSFWPQPPVYDKRTLDEYTEEYPYLKKDWDGLFERHGVTHVIYRKDDVAGLDIDYDFSGLDKIAEDEHFVAYAVPGARA